MAVDFGSLEFENDRVIAAVLTHAIFSYADHHSVDTPTAQSAVMTEYSALVHAVRRQRGVNDPQMMAVNPCTRRRLMHDQCVLPQGHSGECDTTRTLEAHLSERPK